MFYVACSKWRFLAPFRIVVNENQSGILGLFQACENENRAYFYIDILIDSRYIVSTIPYFAMYLNMLENGLEFQIDFESHKF